MDVFLHICVGNATRREQVDTGITSVFLGPELVFSLGEKLSAELGFDWPLSVDNTALQIVPDYRVHAALTFHF